MRLSDDDLKRGWLHPRRVVRNVVAMQFAEALTDDRDVTRHAIRSVQEFGWDNVLTWGYRFSQLPLAEEAAFEWVCDQVERTGKDAPSAAHDDRVQMFGRPATETLESVRGGPFGIFDDDGEYLDDEDDELWDWLEGDELDLQAPASRGGQVGRNETCPCGSGKKYKRCCLRKEPG